MNGETLKPLIGGIKVSLVVLVVVVAIEWIESGFIGVELASEGEVATATAQHFFVSILDKVDN